MDTAGLIPFIFSIVIESWVGLALNLHILIVYIGNLKTGLSLGAPDKVLLTKALVNISLHLAEISQCIIYVFYRRIFFTNGILIWLVTGNMFLTTYSYWLIALLCVYYFVNITGFGHQTLVWLKRSLASYLHLILLVLGLGSLVLSIPNIWLCGIDPTGNTTYQSMFLRGQFYTNVAYRTSSVVLGSFFPLIVAFACTTLTSCSLINHMWTMKRKNMGFTASKCQTQMNATRSMILFLLIAVLYNVILITFFSIPPSVSDDAVIMIWCIIISYPVAEAVVIIQSSGRIRRTFLEKFRRRTNSDVET